MTLELLIVLQVTESVGGPEKKANYAFLAQLCYYVIKNITAKKDWLFDFVVILSQIYMPV